MTDSNSARWQDLARLLDELLALDDHARRAKLEELGRRDPALRLVAEELVDAHLRSYANSTPFEAEGDSAEADSPTDLRIGTVVGGYRLVECLGQGGMARVYRGVREDPGFEHQVAVKLVRPGPAMKDLLDRFRVEQRILAALNHPNIARLFSGGITDGDQPYIVMELVEGSPLDRFCDALALDLEARLRLFLSACRAIEYAHANLVVHRDLKPSNILVSDHGEVRVLDFGVAKLLESEDGSVQAQGTLTSLYGSPMTPAYAAPEQIRGAAVTTRTDVYALGVMLYELLTGYRPFEVEGLPAYERSQRLLEAVPTHPSQRLLARVSGSGADPGLSSQEVAERRRSTIPRLHRRLRGDLDTIVLKALRREPERRYSSVAALREDLERHLAHLPIRARPESWSYTLGRFVRRHRAAVVAGNLAVVSLLAALGIAISGQEEARREAATSERIARFLVETFRAPDPTQEGLSGPVSARELLTHAAARLDDELQAEPKLKARMTEVLAESFLGLGEFEQADSLAAESSRLWARIVGPGARETLATQVLQASALRQMGRLEEATSLYRELTSAVAQNPSEKALQATIANDYAILLADQGELEPAEELYRKALDLHRQLDDLGSQNAIRTRNNLAVCRRLQGDLAEAESLLRGVLEDQRRNLQPPHPDIANALNNLARLVRQKGDLAEAEALYQEALSQRRAALGDTHPDVAQSYNNLGAIRYYEKDLDRAGEYFQKALEILELQFPDDHPRLAAALTNLGSLRRSQERFEEAEAFFRRAVAMDERLFGKDHVHVARDLVRWASSCTAAGRPRDAVPLYERALEIQEAATGIADPAATETARDLAETYRLLGRTEDAEALLARI